MNIKEKRLEKIKVFLDKGYTADIENGIIYNTYGKECKYIENGYIKLGTSFGKKGISILGHQLIYYIATGEVVDLIDHKDTNKSNNRIDNLRSVTIVENGFNRNAKGYYINKYGNYVGAIVVNGKRLHLGLFKKEEDARQAYLDAKKIYHII